MTVGVDNAATGDKRAMVFFPSLARMYTEACICVASGLVRKMMMEEGLLLLPLI
jgi:hypothetical protein